MKMLNELHLRKRNTPDEMVTSYYKDVLEVARKLNIKINEKERPLSPTDFYFDDGDKILFTMLEDDRKIFTKPVQVALGNYFMKNLDEFVRVDEILFTAENYYYSTRPQIEIRNPGRVLKHNDVVPLAKMGLLVKGVINNNALHLIWGDEINKRVRRWFYGNEKDKQVDKQTSTELIPKKSKKNGKKEDDDDLDFLSADFDDEKIALSNLSRKKFNTWFSKRFPKEAKLNTSPLMELYVETLTRSSKYF